MAQYVFHDTIVFKGRDKADPNVIGTELERIARANGGRFHPGAVLTTARKRTSPLHPYFEWNDKVAAEKHRLDQAGTLIRSVRIIADDDPVPRHAFYSIATRDGTAYHMHESVVDNRVLQDALMAAAVRDLEAWERRYRDLADVCQMVRAARERLEERMSKQESRPQVA